MACVSNVSHRHARIYRSINAEIKFVWLFLAFPRYHLDFYLYNCLPYGSRKYMSLKTHSTARTYTIGFVWALVLTNAAFITVQLGLANGWLLVLLLAILAVAQLWIQLHFFLHLVHLSLLDVQLLLFVEKVH